MGSASFARAQGAGTGALLVACVAENGSAAHPYFSSDNLLGPGGARNLCDAIHFLFALHGRLPGIVEHAAGRTLDTHARAFLIGAEQSMAAERALLTRLAVASGPIPSTAGGGGSETAIIHQRNALATLAQSDRQGCALGAALALIVDWRAIRNLLDLAARRLGIDAPPSGFADPSGLREIADAVGQNRSSERALLFGAEQLSLQHRGLWDILEARQQARLAA